MVASERSRSRKGRKAENSDLGGIRWGDELLVAVEDLDGTGAIVDNDNANGAGDRRESPPELGRDLDFRASNPADGESGLRLLDNNARNVAVVWGGRHSVVEIRERE